jgi:hypothetical protein
MNVRFVAAMALSMTVFGCSDPAPTGGTDAAADAPAADAPAADAPAADAPAGDASAPMPGAALVMMFGCRNCHQSTNMADGVLTGQTTPRPMTMAYGSNLTPDMMTGLGAWTEDQIIRAIREGQDETGRTLCRTMPRYGGAPANMSVETARMIAQYLRALPAVSRMIPASTCP